MTPQSLADLAEECRSLMRTARETASRLEFIADALAERAGGENPDQLSFLKRRDRRKD
ncbi:MAG: hypothetical protein AB7O50_13970 [Pseudolabrys sp.]